jgi:hypothetical protein
MLDRRLILMLVLSAALVPLAGRLRPPEECHFLGLDQELFWREKAELAPVQDLILAGDSRTNVNLDPASMASVLSGYRIYNFGFLRVGFSPAYMDRIESELDPASTKKGVVLGITPLSLTRWAQTDNQFVAMMRHRDGAVIRWARPVLDPLLPVRWFLRPIRPKDILYALAGKPPVRIYTENCHALGWRSGISVPPDETNGLRGYGVLFEGNTVSPLIIAVVLDYTRRWTSEGIEVFAYRPPTTEAMLALENEKSGFNEPDFIAQFQAAGGHWVAVTQFGRYSSFDGSHLDEASARALSVDLATAIRDQLRAQAPGDR